jgi:hypothetical protein
MPFLLATLYFLIFLCTPLRGDELTADPPEIWPVECIPCRPPAEPCISPCIPEEHVFVDLVDPVYHDGMLSTSSGGVLTAGALRIQAQKITYVKHLEMIPPVSEVTCSGNLLIDYRKWVLVGDEIHYDFISHQGRLLNGRTAAPPWHIGGKEIQLLEDGTLVVCDGVVTTSEGEVDDVTLCSPCITITSNCLMSARHVHIRVNGIPIFWIPYLQIDLKNIGRSPFALKFGWGGFLGSYISILYRFLSYRNLKGTARIDAFFGKGLGFGLETVYVPPYRPTRFYSRNYYAYDIPLDDPQRKNRYRFQGTFFDRIYGVTLDGMYDFVSDAQMAADYTTKDFDLKTAGRTQLELRQKTKLWIANLLTRVRVNKFQSVNQELPTFHLNWHPFEIPGTGIICQNTFKASYLNYVFSDAIPGEDFSSSRIAVHPFFYRPFFLGPFIATPEAGFIGIAYSNSPDDHSAGQAVGELGARVETGFFRRFSRWKHIAEPYLHYHFLTSPRVPPENHFIFTIQDGLDRLNILRFGVRQSLFAKTREGCILRTLWLDLWANAFFATPTIPQTIPKAYLNFEWIPHRRLICAAEASWNFQHNQIDFYNTHLDWTLTDHSAFGIEYRHRSKYDWRKADFYNFILESVRSEQELLASPLSDQRDILLFRIFTKPTPDWALKLELRHGWNRPIQDPYFEYLAEMSRIIFQHWKLTFKYEKREADNRYSFSLLLNPGPPPKRYSSKS